MIYKVDVINIAKEHFENEIVLINIPIGKYYSVRGDSSVFIMDQLILGSSFEQLTNNLQKGFNISLDLAKNDIDTFLKTLLNEKIVLEVESNETGEFEITSFEKYVSPEIEIYDDMQELIELDPIHDVESGKGWPKKKDA